MADRSTATDGESGFLWPLSPFQAVSLFAGFVLVRAYVALAWPAGGGDTAVYRTVAVNILRNGCVSLSDPASQACVPHWGGNQLPGFPAFVAAVWALAGESDAAVLLAQGVVAAATAIWCGICAGRVARDGRVGTVVAVLLGLSPLGLPWSRFFLTDALSVAATQCVLAELLIGLHRGRLRIFGTSVAFAIALFVRLDNALLVVPIAIVGVSLAPSRSGMLRLVLIAAVAALPVVAWWGRSVAVGLPFVPTVTTLPDGSAAPNGYIRWGNSWMTSQYEYPSWVYPVYGYRYSAIQIPDKAFADDAERTKVAALLAELRTYEGKPIPPEIDDAFSEVVAERYARHPLRQYVVLPAIRAGIMWLDPRYSAGWPVSIGEQSTESVWDLLRRSPEVVLIKGLAALYRTSLAFAAVVLLYWGGAPWYGRMMLGTAVVYAAVQTIAHVALGLIETRYLLGATALLEGSLALAVGSAWFSRPVRS